MNLVATYFVPMFTFTSVLENIEMETLVRIKLTVTQHFHILDFCVPYIHPKLIRTPRFSDNFRENRSLSVRLNLLSIRRQTWRRFLNTYTKLHECSDTSAYNIGHNVLYDLTGRQEAFL